MVTSWVLVCMDEHCYLPNHVCLELGTVALPSRNEESLSSVLLLQPEAPHILLPNGV